MKFPDRRSFPALILTGQDAGDFITTESPYLRRYRRVSVTDPLPERESVAHMDGYRYQEIRRMDARDGERRWGFWVPEGRHWTDEEIMDTLVAGFRRPL